MGNIGYILGTPQCWESTSPHLFPGLTAAGTESSKSHEKAILRSYKDWSEVGYFLLPLEKNQLAIILAVGQAANQTQHTIHSLYHRKEGEKKSGFLNAETLYVKQGKLQGLGPLRSSSECHGGFWTRTARWTFGPGAWALKHHIPESSQALTSTHWASQPHIPPKKEQTTMEDHLVPINLINVC